MRHTGRTKPTLTLNAHTEHADTTTNRTYSAMLSLLSAVAAASVWLVLAGSSCKFPGPMHLKIEKFTTKVHFKMTFFKTYRLYFIPSLFRPRLRGFSSLLQRFVTSGVFYMQQFGTPPKRTATKRTFTLTNYYHPL